MTALAFANPVLREKFDRLAHVLAILVAVTLPWSTSATSICLPLWLLALAPTLEWKTFRNVLTIPAAALPLALVVLAVAGMLWADVGWPERLKGLEPFLKLAVVPLLMWQYSRNERGDQVLLGFFFSSCVLLAVSWLIAIVPQLAWRPEAWNYGIPVKDYFSQSGIFTVCVCWLLERVIATWKQSRMQSALLALLACAFLANMLFVAFARTSLIVIVMLAALLGLIRLSRRGLAILIVIAVAIGAISWSTSSYLRYRLGDIAREMSDFNPPENSSTGARLGFWKHSAAIIRSSPVIGHGVGSTARMFELQTGLSRNQGAPTNPHNQILAVAIPLGFVGVFVLLMMWTAHVRLFMARDPVSWIGLMVVVQNVVGSLFNSHLFDFSQGWLYALGVGVAGGMVLRQRRVAGAAATGQR